MSFPGRQHFTCIVTVIAGGIKCMLGNFIERGYLEALSGFLRTMPHVPFPVADLVLYPFTVIKHNLGNDSILSPVSPPSESLNLGDTVNTSIVKALCCT